jgi:hypothetical protein
MGHAVLGPSLKLTEEAGHLTSGAGAVVRCQEASRAPCHCMLRASQNPSLNLSVSDILATIVDLFENTWQASVMELSLLFTICQ